MQSHLLLFCNLLFTYKKTSLSWLPYLMGHLLWKKPVAVSWGCWSILPRGPHSEELMSFSNNQIGVEDSSQQCWGWAVVNQIHGPWSRPQMTALSLPLDSGLVRDWARTTQLSCSWILDNQELCEILSV
jgi:hypothetical protein